MIDLHTHTTCSDGTDRPRDLVNKAIVQGSRIGRCGWITSFLEKDAGAIVPTLIG